MPPKETPDQRDKKAQAYADTIPDEDVDTGYEPTYRDGSLKSECWDSSSWDSSGRNRSGSDSSWRNDD